MRIRGLFLRSRVARRTFWVLVAAALLPLLLFGGLAGEAYVSTQQREQRRDASEYLKHIGLRAYDRLSAARATLAAHAAEGNWQLPMVDDPAVQALLASLATVDTDGKVRGDLALVEAWHQAGGDVVPARVQQDGTVRGVWWLPRTAAAVGRVFIAWPDPARRGHWLAEVAPAFLWADFAEDGPAASLCLSDARGQLLRCPATPAADAPAWTLFMKAGFGSPDWVLSGRRPQAEAAGMDAVLRIGLTGGAATLLMITTLGLILVRRTMVPLEQLIDGTRRLAGGDWEARVDDRRRDEFGQLAVSFNSMAGRLGRQWQALGVQAAIDREILGGLDLPRVMQQVARRLQALLPQAQVAVVVRRVDSDYWRVFRADDTASVDLAPDDSVRAAADDGLAVHGMPGRTLPNWVQQALPLPVPADGAVSWVPARWHDEPVALLLLAAAQPLTFDDETRREIATLRDRCAVALAAAQREHRLVERAVRDELTGLLNRHGLHDTCDQWLGQRDGPRPFTVLFVDLDGFKEINDSMGHTTGDALLCAVADRLGAALPEGGVLARPGGDEFVMLLPGTPAAEIEPLAAEVCRRLAQPFVLRGQLAHIGASVGLASSPDDGVERDELMRRADLAMYAAKADGRGRWRRYAEAMDAEASERAWIMRDLRQALDTGLIEVHYQPRLDLRSGRTCGAEALVRWPHPERGMISPVRFIPVAEESDLIVALGQYVMDAALAQRRHWRDAGLDVERVAVNVSARQLRDPQFAERVLAMLARHDLRPQDIEIELTESLFAGEASAVERALAPLRARGVQIALDDFGTGFSSLSALKHLPVDVMKIDRSFVIDLGQDHAADAVVRSVIALARDLGKRVVAEGVETALQQQRLLALGCDEVQGYRYAKPLPAPAFVQGARTGFDAPLREPSPEPAEA